MNTQTISEYTKESAKIFALIAQLHLIVNQKNDITCGLINDKRISALKKVRTQLSAAVKVLSVGRVTEGWGTVTGSMQQDLSLAYENLEDSLVAIRRLKSSVDILAPKNKPLANETLVMTPEEVRQREGFQPMGLPRTQASSTKPPPLTRRQRGTTAVQPGKKSQGRLGKK